MADSTDPGLKSKVGKNEEVDIQASPSSSKQPDKAVIEENLAPTNLPDSTVTGDDDKASEKVIANEQYAAVASSGGDGTAVGLTLPKEENAVEIIPITKDDNNVEVIPANEENKDPDNNNGLMIMTLHDKKFGQMFPDPGYFEETSSQDSMMNHRASSEENFISNSDEERLIDDTQDLPVEPTDSLPLLSVSDTDCRPVSGYELKRIPWLHRVVPIVTQNQNGPCPLIAIVNVLLLRGKIALPTLVKVVTAAQLMEYVADCIVGNTPKNLSGITQLNYEQNMHDAIGVLPRLLTGLDVNIKFTGVRDFEYTPECIIFDLLNIPLYHGWLVDPQAKDIMAAVGNLGYNQLVERIIVNKFSDDSEAITQALMAEMFLENSATQLTYHGLCELNSAMASHELAVLFRNNHFSTIYKRGVDTSEGHQISEAAASMSRENELFQLVTDQGFLNEPRVVWEALCNIEGDGLFVDGNFYDSPPKNLDVGSHLNTFVPLPQSLSTEQQINHDFLVALSLQEDQATDQKTNESWEGFEDVGSNSEMSSIDLELARRLQQNYQRDVRGVPSRPPSSSQLRSPDRHKKGSGCTIL